MKPLKQQTEITVEEDRIVVRRWWTSIYGTDAGSFTVYNPDTFTPSTHARLERLLAWDGWQMHEDRTRTGVDDERVIVEYVWEGE